MPRSQRREGLVKLCHFAADGRLGFNDIDREARVGNVQRGLDAGNTAADNQGALGNGAFARGERRVKVDLCNRRFAENDSLFGAIGISLCTQEHCSRMLAISTI